MARRVAAGVLCVAAVAAWGAFDYASRERHLELSGDLRLQAWREWTGIALEKPLLGHGFGRSLLRREGQRGVSQELRQRAPHYLSHGHNLFLDVAVQLGVPQRIIVVRFTTDDFMDQAGVLAFWGYAGVLLGRLDPRSRS